MCHYYHRLQRALVAKAKVESGVLLVERWIIAALRHRKFFSLAELNQAIRQLLERINQRPFRNTRGLVGIAVCGAG
jgi:transposase